MKALFKKQMVDAGLASVLSVILALVFTWQMPQKHVTVNLDSDRAIAAVAIVMGLLGLTLGFGGFLLEEIRGTRAYWTHRGCGERRAFAAKVAADLVAMAGALLLVIAIDALAVAWSSDAGTQIYSRYLEFLPAAMVGVVAHAVGSLGAQLRRPLYVRALFCLLALVGILSWFMLWWVIPWFPQSSPVLACTSFTAVVSLGIYALAYRAFREGADPDRPFAPRVRTACALLAIALVMKVALLGTAALQYVSIGNALRGQPALFYEDSQPARIVARDPSTISSLDREPPGAVFLLPALGAPQRTLGEWDYDFAWSGGPYRLGARWLELPFQLPLLESPGGEKLQVSSWLSLTRGVVVVVARQFRPEVDWRATSDFQRFSRRSSGEGQFVQELKRPDGRRFSTKLSALHLGDDTARNLLFDGDGNTIWRMENNAGSLALARIALPGDDRFMSLDSRIPRDWALALGSRANGYSAPLIVVGERGRYVWDNGQFVDYTPSGEFVLRSEADALRRVDVEVLDANVFATRVRVLDASTKQPIYEHQYSPESSGWSRLALASSLLRPPLVALVAFADERPAQPSMIYLIGEPLLMGRSRPWLLIANLLTSALVAGLLVRRRALGLRWSWLALLLLTGPLVALVPLLLEPRSEPARLVRKVLPARQLVLPSQ